MGWTQLQQRFPWPDVRPDIRPHVHESLICGDDYNPKSGVGQAVHEIADERGYRVEALGNKRFWRYAR